MGATASNSTRYSFLGTFFFLAAEGRTQSGQREREKEHSIVCMNTTSMEMTTKLARGEERSLLEKDETPFSFWMEVVILRAA